MNLTRLLSSFEFTALWIRDGSYEAIDDLFRGCAAAIDCVERF